MSQPVYQLFVGNNNVAANLAWKTMPETERKALVEQEQASRVAAGVKEVVSCDSAWADEMHPWWGVLRFPDLQARIEHTRTLQKIGWLEIVDAFTLLGTAEGEPEEVTIPNPIYKLWIIKNNPVTGLTDNLPQGLDALRWEKHAALYKEFNSQIMLFCRAGWCNEAYRSFGISVYPDIEANMKIMERLDEIGWPAYFDVISYLGIAQ